MRRRRTFLIVFVVLIIVLGGGVAALLFLGGGIGPAPEPTPEGELEILPTATPELESVVVVIQPIRRGERIPPDAVTIRNWEKEALPEEPVYDLEEAIGRFAVVSFSPPPNGAIPLSVSDVKTVVLEGSDISLAIPSGRVAYAFPIRLVSAVAGVLKPGDRVDVMISWTIIEVDENMQLKLPVLLTGTDDCLAGCQPAPEEGQIPGFVSQYTVQNAVVLGVGMWEEEEVKPEIEAPPTPEAEGGLGIPLAPAQEEEIPTEAPPPTPAPSIPPLSEITVVTLAIEPQYALVLKWALETNSAIDLVLRSAVDLEEFSQPEAVTMEYMINRYQISLPPRLPHALENKFEYRLIKEAEELDILLKAPQE